MHFISYDDIMIHMILYGDIVASFFVYFRGFLEVLVTKIWSSKNQSTLELPRFKESNTLLVTQNDTRIISSEDTRYHS